MDIIEVFAEKSGLYRMYISALECKKRSIVLDNIQKIADALEIEPYLLFKRINIKKGEVLSE